MSRFYNKVTAALTPYTPGEQPKNIDEVIKLNTNENPYPPTPKIRALLQNLSLNKLRIYPDPISSELRNVIANQYQLNPNQVFIGNGSDEILSLIFKTFLNPGDCITIPYPNYSLYKVLAAIHDMQCDDVKYGSIYRIYDPKLLYERDTSAIFFAHPNAPTGFQTPIDDIKQILRHYKGLFICDEAYIDFGGDSAVGLIKEFDNILVLRTFSKSFSLCGIRIGYAMAHESLIKGLLSTKDSYNCNVLSQLIATEAMKDYAWMERNALFVQNDRKWLTQELEHLKFEVLDSKTNFLYVKIPSDKDISAKNLYEKLRERNIYIRYFGDQDLTDYLRISIGTRDQLERLLAAIEDLMS